MVGDALNPVTDAIRTEERIEWVGVRHEEAAAFAVSAQAQLTGTIGVCMGTVGPGSIHLLNGLYDAKKSHAPVLAICGQVPSEELGSDFFQEVDNDRLFADVAVYCQTVTSASQLPSTLEQAVNAAYAQQGVAVLTLPGDLGDQELPKHARPATFAPPGRWASAPEDQLAAAAEVLNGAGPVTLLVGMGAREARDQVLELAECLQAPMVLTLKAKEGLERDNPFQVGQSGLIGNPAAAKAMDDCDVLFLVAPTSRTATGTRRGRPSIQLDARQAHVGRRTVGRARPRRRRRRHPARAGAAAVSAVRQRPPRRGRVGVRRRGTAASSRCSTRTTTPRSSAGCGRSSTTRRPDPARGGGRGRGPARRTGRHLHHRHRHVDGVAVAVRHDERPAPAGRLLQPRLDGQRDAARARRRRPWTARGR